MAISYNPSSVTSGLVLCLDAANPRNFDLTKVEVLVVAGGGGGGGGDVGSGGGAGGLIYSSNFAVTPGTQLTANVGDGGAGSSTYNIDGSNGGNSVFGALTAIGGGGGASWSSGSGQDGGSGGGGVGGNSGGLGTVGQGFSGGTGLGFPDYPQAGGGGAGGAGQNAPSQILAGNGGIGLFFPQFSSVGGNPAGWFAGGGGGGVEANQNGNSITPGNGGLGGGGGGGRQAGTAIIATAGTPNTGGGGGGNDPGTGGAGGSGIIIVRYQGPQKAKGGTITSNNGYTIHTFTTSGTFTPLVATNNSAILGLSDLSGNGNFGTTENSPTYSSANGGALVFDGSNDYIALPHDALWKNIKNITYDLWFQTAAASTRQGLISSHENTGGSNQDAIEIEIQSNNTSFVGFRSTNGSFYMALYNTTLSTNTWYNLTGVLTDSSIIYYLNGTQVATSGWPGTNVINAPASTLLLAKYAGLHLNGRIGTFKAYNRALTAAEVSQNYNALRGRFGI